MADSMWVKTDISRKTQPCPICGKQDYCFYLTHAVDGNKRFYCHRTQSQTDVTGLDGQYYYYVKHSDSSNTEVFESESDRAIWRSKAPKKDGVGYAEWRANYYTEPIEGEMEVASVGQRNLFNRMLTQYMRLSVKHEAALKKDWNSMAHPHLFEDVIAKYPILSCPPNDYVTSRYGYKGDKSLPKRDYVGKQMSEYFSEIYRYPGFIENLKGTPTVSSQEGMWFPIYDKDGNLISWRNRLDYPEVKGEYEGKEGVFVHSYGKSGEEIITFYPSGEQDGILVKGLSWPPKGKTQGKYKNLCGVYEKKVGEKRVNGYGKGCRVGSLLSLYTQPGDNPEVVFLTEGEKKAMVANILLGYPVVSIPGVLCFMKLFEKESDGESLIESLQKKGLKMAVVCYDADKAENQAVLSAQNGLADALAKNNLRVAIGEWNGNWGKGLDDALVQGIKPTIYPVSFALNNN